MRRTRQMGECQTTSDAVTRGADLPMRRALRKGGVLSASAVREEVANVASNPLRLLPENEVTGAFVND